MKKLLLILLIFLISQAFAFEDYLIVSETAVSSLSWDDDNVISAAPVITIDNKKKSVILKAKNIGKTVLTIETEDGIKSLDVEVGEDKTTLTEIDGLNYFPLDVPFVKPQLRGEK